MYRLLIADDERLERDALRFIVQKTSEAIEEVRDASNGREAVSKSLQFRPHICILDIKMPGLSGIEAAKQIRQLLPGVRIVFLTAFDYFDYAKEAIRIGADDYIIKPASEKNVVEVIQRIAGALDRERTERERSERVEQKLDLVSTVLENELAEGLARGFVAAEKLTEYAGLREFRFESIVVARTALDYGSYPMKIEGDSQKTILRKRCMRLMQHLLEERGWLVVVAPADGGINSICYLPAAARPDGHFEDLAAHIRRELAITTTTGLSPAVTDVSLVTKALSEAFGARRRGLGLSNASTVPPNEPSAFPPREMEGRLLEAISTGDRRAADTATDDVYNWLRDHTRDLRELCRMASEFSVVIRHSLSYRFPQASGEGERLSDALAVVSEPQQVRSALQDQVAALFASPAGAAAQSVPVAIRRVREFIDACYHEEISLDRLAAEVHQSTYHLSRLFKRYTGLTVVEYLNSVRIEQAKRLLQTGKLTMKEVSLNVGFADSAYFARVFRRLEGVSPSTYRDRLVG